MKELVTIQQKLKAPKGQYNTFGKYKYRSCEDILESVKPVLAETKCTLTLSDEMIAVGDRIYVKATDYCFCKGRRDKERNGWEPNHWGLIFLCKKVRS